MIRWAPRTVGLVCALAMVLSAAPHTRAQTETAPEPQNETTHPTFVYVGTALDTKTEGIHLFRLQTRNLEVSQNVMLVPLGLAAETAAPSYLEIDVPRRLVFVVNEVDRFGDKPTGSVSAFRVETDGRLTRLAQQSSLGKSPTHLVLDRAGRHLLVSNNTGLVAVLPVAADGSLGEPRHSAGRGSHGAGVALDPANRFAFLCDQGLDQIEVFRFDATTGSLAPHAPSVALKSGAGPRRLVFRPDARFAYVLNEQHSTVTAFAYDAEAGKMTELETVATIPEHFDGTNAAAEIGMHPDGKYLYVSNRGHNSVVLFRVDPARGTLTWVEEQTTGGRDPIHFGIDPAAKHVAIINHDSDSVLVARIDAANGRLRPSGVFASVSRPACAKFLPPATGGTAAP